MNCPQLKQKYEELQDLQGKFEVLFVEFKEMKSKSPAERDILASELNILQNKIGKIIDENFIQFSWKEKIIKFQEKALSEFFGKKIHVPKIPSNITKEQVANWEKQGMEMIYLPEEDMTEDKSFPGWTMRPTDLFFFIKEGDVSPEATKIKSGWRLIDKIKNPIRTDHRSFENLFQGLIHENDPLRDAIIKLRNEGAIRKFNDNHGSRFGFTDNDLFKPEVKNAFALALSVDSKNMRSLAAIERNVIGHIYHQEWDNSFDDATEWLNDKYGGDKRLASNGISNYETSWSNSTVANRCFRLLIDLP